MHHAFFEPQLNEQLLTKLNAQENKPGLYLVATPIGNIFDISLRALQILSDVDIIFAEDTRNSRNLLNSYGIKKTLVACHEFNETDEAITSKIRSDGRYALISDAGTPGISDPGYRIVNWCLEHDINVVPIPGACAFVTGLCASGMPTDRFTFYGFISAKANARKEFFKTIRMREEVAIFLESPKRILNFLTDACEILGDRTCCLCRELTKIHETFHRGKLSEQIEFFSKNEPLGEFVVILQGNTEKIQLSDEELEQQLMEILKTHSVKDTVQLVSSLHGLPKKYVYEKALKLK